MKSYLIEDSKGNVLNYTETLSGAKQSFLLLDVAAHDPFRIVQLSGPDFGQGYHLKEYKPKRKLFGGYIFTITKRSF